MSDAAMREYNDRRWRYTVAALAFGIVVILLAFHETAMSLWHQWSTSETFAHGFLILPITLWLVWQKRSELLNVTPDPVVLPILLAVPAAALWLLGRVADVQIVMQFALVTILILFAVSLLGWKISRYLTFPLLFLYFAVPAGEELIPPMMEFTATFTVEALRLTGIPVYRDGLYFSLPSGNWSVVEACSGIRYLIASLVLGFLYAYVSYQTLWKRLAFIALSIVVPIIANGLRAYMIVMIGHLSGMELAVGVDHLLYCWVFFGIVMLLLFWLGSFMQEKHDHIPPDHAGLTADSNSLTRISVVLVLNVALVGVASGTATSIVERAATGAKVSLTAPIDEAGWTRIDEPFGWQPFEESGGVILEATYTKPGMQNVDVFIALFAPQRQGHEAIGSETSIGKRGKRRIHERGIKATNAHPAEVRVTLLDNGRVSREIWHWYNIAGRNLTNPYEGKLWEAVARIYPGRSDGSWMSVATAPGENANETLNTFLAEMQPAIERMIKQAVQPGS